MPCCPKKCPVAKANAIANQRIAEHFAQQLKRRPEKLQSHRDRVAAYIEFYGTEEHDAEYQVGTVENQIRREVRAGVM